jgi:DnaK suppressor protein
MALTPQKLEHYRSVLIARRDELARGTVRVEDAVGDTSDLEHLDPVDRAVADNAKDELLQSAGRDSEQLVQIEDALRAMEDGRYGICEACGNDIPTSRLDAVPWALLCVKDQEISDERRRNDGTVTGGAPSRVVA